MVKTRSEVFRDDPRGVKLTADSQKIPAPTLMAHLLEGGLHAEDEWSRFTEEDLHAWFKPHGAAAAFLFSFRAAGRPDEHSVPFLADMPPDALACIVKADHFPQKPPNTTHPDHGIINYPDLTEISVLCRESLSRLRQTHDATDPANHDLIPTAIAAAVSAALESLHYPQWRHERILNQLMLILPSGRDS